ncbi:hypothetical protein [uncultured Clostridium sp.]|uniref:hypothetical protein n=1 Tax=uncultured Clostridium sp. TaxID=59620 RepID=UPI002592707E|nr:hypothetical protein [uncultured Clostridium sp.]
MSKEQLLILIELVVSELRSIKAEEYLITSTGSFVSDAEKFRMELNQDLYNKLLKIKEILEQQYNE